MKILDITIKKLYNLKKFTIRRSLWIANFSNNVPNAKKNFLLIGEVKNIVLLSAGKVLLLRSSQMGGEEENYKRIFALNVILPSPQLIVGKSIVLKNVYRIIETIKDRQLNFLKENVLAVKNLFCLSNKEELVKNIALINAKTRVAIRGVSPFNLNQILNGKRKINGEELGGGLCKEINSLVKFVIFDTIHLNGKVGQDLKSIT